MDNLADVVNQFLMTYKVIKVGNLVTVHIELGWNDFAVVTNL